MNVSTFLRHWSIRENPFMAEEARQDDVLARLDGHSSHPDLAKIRGDLSRPASAVVFGEKGSGKTAIRLRLEEDIREHNKSHADRKVLTIAYDELNPVLDRFARRVKSRSSLEALEQLRLVGHIDGLLSVTVPDLKRASLTFAQEVTRDGDVLCRSTVSVASVDAETFRPRRLPPGIREAAA